MRIVLRLRAEQDELDVPVKPAASCHTGFARFALASGGVGAVVQDLEGKYTLPGGREVCVATADATEAGNCLLQPSLMGVSGPSVAEAAAAAVFTHLDPSVRKVLVSVPSERWALGLMLSPLTRRRSNRCAISTERLSLF